MTFNKLDNFESSVSDSYDNNDELELNNVFDEPIPKYDEQIKLRHSLLIS